MILVDREQIKKFRIYIIQIGKAYNRLHFMYIISSIVHKILIELMNSSIKDLHNYNCVRNTDRSYQKWTIIDISRYIY